MGPMTGTEISVIVLLVGLPLAVWAGIRMLRRR